MVRLGMKKHKVDADTNKRANEKQKPEINKRSSEGGVE